MRSPDYGPMLRQILPTKKIRRTVLNLIKTFQNLLFVGLAIGLVVLLGCGIVFWGVELQ